MNYGVRYIGDEESFAQFKTRQDAVRFLGALYLGGGFTTRTMEIVELEND